MPAFAGPAIRTLYPNELSEARIAALGRLLCLLESGEGAAKLSFVALAQDCPLPGAERALARIAREEANHGAWVAAIARRLPQVAGARPVIQASRRLHAAIGRGTVTDRLAGVAALDSAACIIFSWLLRPGAPLAALPAIWAVLHRIHHDEARHVAIASCFAAMGGQRPQLREHGAEIRAKFADVLELVAADFDQLSVDPDSLLRAVRYVAADLFA